ncbi:hypothetical protein E2C01_059950 [Portunus trituberculatus]|uniref:Uncharacterized protein n=1 Tax=Portunus trituberculatus TaxID=210409 RepID=A0A5B7HAP0_PORTR|nr:hypothetical protein [Portunus trituberculatus]
MGLLNVVYVVPEVFQNSVPSNKHHEMYHEHFNKARRPCFHPSKHQDALAFSASLSLIPPPPSPNLRESLVSAAASSLSFI